MKIRSLVTGSRGFIGKNLSKYLLDSGHLLMEWDLGNKEENYAKRELSELLRDSQPDVIFHVGANANTLENEVNKIMFENVEITRDLVEFSKETNTPIIYSSSAACYGAHGARPSNLYAWTKWMGEMLVSAAGGVSLRYFNVFGQGEEHKGSMASFMYQAFEKSKRAEPVRLFPGLPLRDFISVSEVVRANLHAMEIYSSIRGGVFDVGTGVANSFERCLDLFEIPWTYTSQEAIPPGYQFFTRANSEKFLPDWKCSKDFETQVLDYLRYLHGGV